MLILLLFVVGLVMLLLPLLSPVATLVQRLLALFVSPGVASYSKSTLRNTRQRVFRTQLSLLFGYTLILFIDTIANSQNAILLTNLKYYYGSVIQLTPADSHLSTTESLIAQMKADPVLSSLSFAWISQPLRSATDTRPSLTTPGRVVGRDLEL